MYITMHACSNRLGYHWVKDVSSTAALRSLRNAATITAAVCTKNVNLFMRCEQSCTSRPRPPEQCSS